MKIPQWIYKREIHVQHPAGVLKNVARVLDMEAGFYRRERNTEAARALKRAAVAIRSVAEGTTYAEAFDFADQPSAAPSRLPEEK